MGTLAAALQTNLTAVVAAATLTDLSRQRETTAGENTARTAAVCAMAAAKVQAYLGNVDDSDAQAVAWGTDLAALEYAARWPMTLPDTALASRDRVMQELERLAASRVAENADPVAAERDFTGLDTRYPATKWQE